MRIKPNLYRRVLSEGIGVGGWSCPCCGPAPGKAKDIFIKAGKKRFNRLLTRLIEEELESENEDKKS